MAVSGIGYPPNPLVNDFSNRSGKTHMTSWKMIIVFDDVPIETFMASSGIRQLTMFDVTEGY